MLPIDTSTQAARQQIRSLQQMSGSDRLNLAFQLSDMTRNMSIRALRRSMGDDGDVEDLTVNARYIELHYGAALAQKYILFMRSTKR